LLVSPRRSPGDGTVFKRKSDNLWVAGFTVEGHQYRATAKNRNDAIAKRKEMRKQLEDGVKLGAGKAKLSTWLDRWLTNHKPDVDPETFRSYATTVRLYVNPHLGSKRLDKLEPDDVREMITKLQKTSPRNAQKAYTVLRLALKAAVDERKISWNAAQVVGMPKHTPSRAPAFTVKEALHIMTAADASCDEVWAARWKAAIMTGKRECEVLGLEWDRVDLVNGFLRFDWQLQELTKVHGCGDPTDGVYPCGKVRVSFCPDAHWDFPTGFEYRECQRSLVWTRPKTLATQEQPMPIMPQLRVVLEHLQTLDGPNPKNLVFHHPDGSAISQSQDQKAWRRLLAEAKVPHRRQHTLRRTAATLMQAAKVDQRTRMKLFGHTTPDAHQVYLDDDWNNFVEAMAAYGDILTPQDLDGES
jgi:integrase